MLEIVLHLASPAYISEVSHSRSSTINGPHIWVLGQGRKSSALEIWSRPMITPLDFSQMLRSSPSTSLR